MDIILSDPRIDNGTVLTVLVVACLLLISCHKFKTWQRYNLDTQFGIAHGCLLAPCLLNNRVLGIDRLREIWQADREGHLMELFLWHFRKWGNTLEQKLLRTTAFGTIDPENLQAVLSTKSEDWDYGPRRKIAYPLFGDGIFTQDGLPWKHSRELLRPQFVHRNYQDLSLLHEPTSDLLECITAAAAKNSIVDLQPLFFRFTLDTTTAFLFGDSIRSLKGRQDAVEFEEAFNFAQSIVAKKLRLGELYWLIGGWKFRRACKIVHRFTDQLLDQRLMGAMNVGEKEDGDERYAFLDTLANEFPDRKTLRCQTLNILLAGRDTTACLLSWILNLLVRHPNVMRKLRNEIESTLTGVKAIGRNHLKSMKYLNNVIKETLRLFPPVPVNQRCAARTTTLPIGGGLDRKSPVLIRRGQGIAYSVYSLHRRIDLYGEDVEDFRPERWDEDMGLYRDEITKAWGYLPFNGGPRVCLGMDFAKTEAAYAIVKILQQFPIIALPVDEAVVHTGKENQKMTLVLSVGDGCRVCLG